MRSSEGVGWGDDGGGKTFPGTDNIDTGEGAGLLLFVFEHCRFPSLGFFMA